jgi:hypothetical protein
MQGVYYALLFSYIEGEGAGQRADVTLNLWSEMSSWISDLTRNLSRVSQARVTQRTR